MKFVFAFSILFFSLTSTAQVFQRLGERDSSCKDLKTDSYTANVHPQLSAQSKSMFENDRLQTIYVTNPECFRTGTEIKIILDGIEIPYIGRALIRSLRILSPKEMMTFNGDYQKDSVIAFVNESKASQYGVLDIRISEKVKDSFVDGRYQRLPTCFPTYNDWETYDIDEKLKDKELPNILNGKTKAAIWNGTFNCYKVGVRTKITIYNSKDTTDYGNVIPSQLYVVHHSHLTQTHADFFATTLTELKDSLKKDLDRDGGYVTFVVFDYEAPQPVADKNSVQVDMKNSL